MEKAQYAIMRFAKYKGPEIGNIEAHNERTKEKYASNPDVDTSRSKYNFHLVKPPGKYRAESERQIAAAGCRTRKDSIRMIETLFTASPEFFKGKKRAEIRAGAAAHRRHTADCLAYYMAGRHNAVAVDGPYHVVGAAACAAALYDKIQPDNAEKSAERQADHRAGQ